ncbi:hypothetical protein ASPSYDRAFT_407924 [Aspergillus sydowii CBS 593.65]|uniref:Transcription factor domain-containing protein n=1 Tax=Aspergillus sydowii CBS 593.65 TaxID=1036612 RepID=A0A1L9TA60_9EURO|nr:uncharacterized protein ASPSYDRAFT_407924 [Aspergillus sydowii CBS 593.65]OJJ56255.1 hypothetical protein ASPSYDRAFT_407924 [Aspergillus sydowii CBS 593.65]
MMDPVICLLFIDTTTAFINRRVPIIRSQPRRPGVIDRFAGLCCDLLPSLYGACVVLATGEDAKGTLDIQAWNDVYEQVKDWKLQIPLRMMAILTSNERTIFLTQAYAYRLVTLLILHQARYSADLHCKVRAEYTEQILSHMERCLLLVGEPPPHTLLPIFVAAMDLSTQIKGNRALQVLQSCRGASYYPYTRRLYGMCSEFWSQRDAGGSSDWLTYLDQFHPLNIPI